MAKIENLKDQLRITDSGGVNDTIVYYNKENSEGETELFIKAVNGDLIISRNGVNVESFTYSSIELPTSENLEALTLTVHKYVHDSSTKKNIDSGYASIVTNTDGLSNCSNYTHDPSTSTVECLGNDIENVLFIFNQTLGRVLYMLGSEDYTGKEEKGIVTYDVRIPLSNKSDKLYILFRPIKGVTEKTYLRDIKVILDESLIQSKLIAMILKESYDSPFSESDVKYN